MLPSWSFKYISYLRENFLHDALYVFQCIQTPQIIVIFLDLHLPFSITHIQFYLNWTIFIGLLNKIFHPPQLIRNNSMLKLNTLFEKSMNLYLWFFYNCNTKNLPTFFHWNAYGIAHIISSGILQINSLIPYHWVTSLGISRQVQELAYISHTNCVSCHSSYWSKNK